MLFHFSSCDVEHKATNLTLANEIEVKQDTAVWQLANTANDTAVRESIVFHGETADAWAGKSVIVEGRLIFE